MLIDSLDLLKDAMNNKYAVPAFNVENMEMIQSVLEACNELKSPVILQTTPSTLKYAEPEYFFNLVKAAQKYFNVPTVLHLDHGDSYELVVKCLKVGYSSIMYDGSKLSFNENVENTKKVVEISKLFDVYVEGEIGRIGGKEDDLIVENAKFTDSDEAKLFVHQTNVNSLAVAIGTVHGLYKEEPNLNFNVLEKISNNLNIPLVLHGTSGVDDLDVKKTISLGICKVNYATDLRRIFSNSIKEYINNNPNVIDPKKYLLNAKYDLKEFIKEKILVCGSNNKY